MTRRVRPLVHVAGGVVSLIGLAFLAVYVTGSLLPATRTGTAQADILATPAQVMAVTMDVSAQPRWRPDVHRVTGDASQVWTEHKHDGESIRFTVVERSANALTLAFESSRGYSGQWRGTMKALGRTTRLHVQESATINSPMQRVLARLFFHPDEFAAAYLALLASEVERRYANASETSATTGTAP